MFGGFKTTKIKPQLKMAVHRFQIASNKKVAQIKNQKRDIAKLLAEKPHPKEEKARIRAEALIREDSTVEAYEILQLHCELLSERIKLIASEKKCPPDLVSVVSTLIWASARVDITELVEIRKQFKSKYGKAFEEAALHNENSVVNERVFAKLSVLPPPALLVQTYLEKISEEFDVNWKPKMPLLPEEMSLPARAPTGDSIPAAAASGYGDTFIPTVNAFPASPEIVLPSAPGAHAISGPPPAPKPDLPTAHVGLSIPPPFAIHDEDDHSGNHASAREYSDDEVEEINYVPDSKPRNIHGNEVDDFHLPTPPRNTFPNSYAPNETDKDDDNNDDDDDNGDNYMSDSFRDLEARFANLKK